MKEKKIPVCKCGENSQECSKCGEGFMQRTLNGQVPHFKTIEIPLRRVPVCKCKLELAECDKCKSGYLQATQRGEVPLFILVEVSEDMTALNTKETEPDQTKKTGDTGLCFKAVGLCSMVFMFCCG